MPHVRLTHNTVGGLFQEETVVPLEAALLGEHGFRNEAVFRIQARARPADSVARTCRQEVLAAFQTDAVGATRRC